MPGGLHRISTKKQLSALGSPVRHQIHQLVDALGPCSARELAPHMGRSAESLYYHLHELKRAGILVEAGTGRGVRRSEAMFDVVGRPCLVDPKVTSAGFLKLVCQAAVARLRFAARGIEQAIKDRRAIREGPNRSWRLEQYTVRMNRRDVAMLNRKIDEVMTLLRERNTPDGDQLYSVTIAASRGSLE